VARIKPGFTRDQVAASYAGVYAAIVDKEIKDLRYWPDPNLIQQIRRSRLTFIDGSRGHSVIQEFGKYPLYILIAATCMVLLIAMVNAANLLLTRSAARRRELAICAAIGAGRRKLVSQLLSEALLLALAGGVAGIALSMLIMSALKLLLTQTFVIESISLDFLKMDLEWPVLLYGLGLSVFTGLLFGLYPALEAARVAPIKVLNQESGHISEAPASAHVRKSLVCAQVMLSAVLLIPTGHFLKSLVMLGNVDLGMQTRNIITFRRNPAVSGYTSEQKRSLFERMEQAVSAIPGVSGVTSTDYPLLNNETRNSDVMIDGYAAGKVSRYILVGTGFFRQMGIPLLMGRDFNEHDSLAGQKVAIVNEKFVKTFFNGQNPIGRKIRRQKSDMEIVGVAKDTSISRVGEKPAETFYLPWRQNEIINSFNDSGMAFYVRSSLPLNQVVAQVRKVALAVDPNIPLEGFRTLEDQVDGSLLIERLLFQIAATLAILATALAMMGLYGVMAYSVIRRTREIGIRMAVGANPSEIRHMVLREMLRILSVGLVLGIPLALVISKIAESVLFGVKAYDPVVILGSSLALGLAAFASTYLPAWKASRVDPLFALRAE
jgi:putative ABC transport system permease protein